VFGDAGVGDAGWRTRERLTQLIVGEGMSGDGNEALAKSRAEQAHLDSVVAALNEVCRNATLDLAFRVGELIVCRLFRHDPGLWDRGRGVRDSSYRALAARGDLILGPAGLCRAVSVYVLITRLGGRARWAYLSASDVQEVLPLPEPEQRLLLETAEAGRWSVARLRSEIQRRRSPRDRHASRALVRSLRKLGGRLAKHTEALAAARPTELDAEQTIELEHALEEVSRQLAELRAELRAHSQPPPRQVSKSDSFELDPARVRVAK